MIGKGDKFKNSLILNIPKINPFQRITKDVQDSVFLGV